MNLRFSTVPAHLQPRVVALRDAWRRKHGLRTFYAGTIAIGLGYPAAYPFYLQLTEAPDRHPGLHLVVGAIAWLSLAAAWFVPSVQRLNWRLHSVTGVPMLVASAVIVVDAKQNGLYVAALMLMVCSFPLFYVCVRQMALVYATGFIADLAYTLARGETNTSRSGSTRSR